jgi:hypothetical protein
MMADTSQALWRTSCCGYFHYRSAVTIDEARCWIFPGNNTMPIVTCPNPYCSTRATSS